MKMSSRARGLLLVSLFTMALSVSVPVRAFSQGRGNGQDKKAAKFVNGHDARDGRWDGRGPRPRLVRVWRPHPHRHFVWRAHPRRHSLWWRRHYHRRD
jgi:hypothetical protein